MRSGPAGEPEPIEAELASDGIDEFLTLFFDDTRRWAAATVGGSVHVHATDTPGEWLVRETDDGVTVTAEHAKGDAAVRGHGQRPAPRAVAPRSGSTALEVIGDRDVAERFLGTDHRSTDGVPRRPAAPRQEVRVVGGGGRSPSARPRASWRPAPIVTVVAPTSVPGCEMRASSAGVTVEERAYRPGDLAGAWLAVAATDDPAAQQAVFDDGEAGRRVGERRR